MTQAFKDFLANPFIGVLGSIPLLATLCLLGGLQALDDPRGVIWIPRLWKASVWLGAVFVVFVSARFVMLSA